MVQDFSRDLVREKKKKNRELISEYRKKLQNELESYCEELGGHNFMPWKDDSWLNVGGHYNECYKRECWDCGAYIYKERKDIDKIFFGSEFDLEKCGDIEGLPYRVKNSYKIHLGTAEGFYKNDLIIIKTEVKDHVAYIESVLEDHLIVHIF